VQGKLLENKDSEKVLMKLCKKILKH